MYDFPFMSMNCECPICKQRVNDNALYCPNCGYFLKSNFFPIDVDLKKYNVENDINNKEEKIEKNIKQNIITDNMIIGIKIPVKLDLDKVVDNANKVMEKVSVFLESKKNSSEKSYDKKIEELEFRIIELEKIILSLKSIINNERKINLINFDTINEINNYLLEYVDNNEHDIQLNWNFDSEDLKTNYVIEYRNEIEFHKKERNLKEYNMLAYKKLLYDYYSSFREGNFQGVLVFSDFNEKIEKYQLVLPTDKSFKKVYGDIILHYTIFLKQKIVMLDNITSEDIFLCDDVSKYKEVVESKSHKEKDIFKINLLNSMKGN